MLTFVEVTGEKLVERREGEGGYLPPPSILNRVNVSFRSLNEVFQK